MLIKQGVAAVKKPITNYLFNWDEASQFGVQVVGGKGWNLGRLARYGFRVPKGGVLTTQAYEEFIEQNKLQDLIENISKSLNAGNRDEAEFKGSLVQLRERIIVSTIPQQIVDDLTIKLSNQGILERPLAVRSSASAEDSMNMSFAGIHESFLNILGIENILAAIKECYTSLWTPRAVAYRQKMDIKDSEMSQAVVIMEMVEARSAGVAFTCDPQTGREDILVVNANFGLGESVVNGAIEPDTYYLDTSAYRAVPHLKAKNIGSKQGMTKTSVCGGTHFVLDDDLALQQVLSDKSIEKLGLLIMRVFESLGDCEEHQDVEWAFDGQDFILLQARPVTVLPTYTFEALKNKTQVWSNGNYRDAVPMVISPIHRRVMKNIIDTIQYTSFSEPGYHIPEGFQFSRFFKGRLYCNMSALQWAHNDSTGMLPKDFNPFWGGHQPEIEIADTDPFKGEIGLERQQRAMKGVSLMMEAAAEASGTFAEIARFIESLIGTGFERISDRSFIDKFNELGRIIKSYCEKYSFLSGVGTWKMMVLLQKLSGYLGPRIMIVLNGLMVGGEAGITSADHGYRLIELAQLARQDEAVIKYLEGNNFNPRSWDEDLPENSTFKKRFRDFIKEYGHRAVYELDIINPRWEEDPSYLMDIIKSTMADANYEQWKAGQKEKFDQAWREVTAKVPNDELAEIRKGIKEAQEGAAVREMTKSLLVITLKPYRLMALELGKRLTQRGIIEEQNDVFYCSWSDLVSILDGDWNGEGLRILVAARKASQREKEAFNPPDVILGEEPVFSETVSLSSSDCLPGVAAAGGKACGIARLIRHPEEGNRLQPGDVLVAPSTDPGWTPLFLKACAVVMETGGYLSHGSIVAREFGVPAVVNVPGVMRIIKDGQKIVVDGDEGKVFL
jgi:pyruvate,water dikinase